MTSTTTPEAQAQSGSQPGGLWFKLPPELRLEIYELMFPQESVHIVAARTQLEREANANVSAGGCVAILATCRAIYDGAKPILNANTCFEISCSPGYECASTRPVDIQQARTINLNIELTRQSSGASWLDRLPDNLHSFSNLQKIHIKLWTKRYPVASVQKQADHVLSSIPRLRGRKGFRIPITAAMDSPLGGMGFVRANYHRMCRIAGVSDRTDAVYTDMQTALSSEHASIQRELAVLSARLDVKLSELTEIKKDECWSVRPASKARADQAASEMQSITDDMFKLHENTDRTKRGTESLQRQRQLLMSGP